MIDLYTWTTPNGRKPAIMLEECGLEYSVHPINIRNGDQFKPEYVKICPNSKIPAIVDHDAGVSIFESGAILVHLAEKTGEFFPAKNPGRAKVLEWLFWQMANVGPMFGQAGHFVNAAPEKIQYAIDRYANESRAPDQGTRQSTGEYRVHGGRTTRSRTSRPTRGSSSASPRSKPSNPTWLARARTSRDGLPPSVRAPP